MRLTKVHVTNFRNIIDSGEVEIGETTCLVGKNESGKTAFLKAIEGLNSTNANVKKFERVENYPRRYLADYENRHGEEEATVIVATWELDEDDAKVLAAQLGPDALKSTTFTSTKTYDHDSVTIDLSFSDDATLPYLVKKFGLTHDDVQRLAGAKTTQQAAKNLGNLAEKTTQEANLLAAIQKFRNNSARQWAIDTLWQRAPKFLYFSHYDRMSGEVSIQQIERDKKQGGAKSGDQVFLDFLELAGTTLEELATSTRFEELNARCEAAANHITDQLFEYWTQNDELQIKVSVSEGKSADPPPFNQGTVARARVENKLHRVTVPFSDRSAGFIWFFSFLVKFATIRESAGDVILLLDEPGLTLHGTAQSDLLRYFKEKVEPQHQIIYTTHSPFMVPADNLVCVRTVEDVVEVDRRGRKTSHGTRVRSDVLSADRQTNFPIFGAMGFEITQTLIIGKNTLLVEGPSDILYLQAASSVLKKLGRTHLAAGWSICPSGGIDKVLPFVRLFYGNGLNIAVLTDFERGQGKKLDELHKSALLEDGRITLATEIAGKDEADIEDFFEPSVFVELVNATYSLKGELALTAEKLEQADVATKRLVKKAEAYFRLLPASIAEFSHFDPALYLLKHPELLEGKGTAKAKTLERFETALARVNRFLVTE